MSGYISQIEKGEAPVRDAQSPPEALIHVVRALAADQERSRHSLNLTPPENLLSPLARLPLVMDGYSRYFFDHLSKFGSWTFYGGLDVGRIELEILQPLLQRLARAEHVNVQPISGLNCMTVAIAALTRPGDTMLTVPLESGGHMSTARVARRLGVRTVPIPMRSLHEVDVDALVRVLRAEQPALVYLDQSTQLFPIDPRPIRTSIDQAVPSTLLHFDSSHINGLILFEALDNPLDCGCDTFGGSTHKTLPGPHKGFLATRAKALADRIQDMADVFVSHHHTGEVLSLTLTLLELEQCGGTTYAQRVCKNAKRLGASLSERGVRVAAAERGFTGCHQIWVDPADREDAIAIADNLLRAGVVVNRLSDVPGYSRSVLRLSVAEITRLGATTDEVDELADLLAAAIVDDADAGQLRDAAASLRTRLGGPSFSFDTAALAGANLPRELSDLLSALERFVAPNAKVLES